MTRQEEIQNLIDEETGIDNYGSLDYQIGVCDGVRLADKTMIEKACSILEDMTEGRLGKRFINEFKNKLTYGVLERH